MYVFRGLTPEEPVTSSAYLCHFSDLQVEFVTGVLTVPGGDNVIRLLPPLNMSEAEIGQAVDLLDQAASAIEAAK